MDRPTSESHLHVMSLKIDVALILDGQLGLLHNAPMHHFFRPLCAPSKASIYTSKHFYESFGFEHV